MASTPTSSHLQLQLDDPVLYYQSEHWSREQLLTNQARALQICRQYAYAHSPFYQRFHQGLLDSPLQALPVLTKEIIMENFDDLVTDRAVHLHDVQEYMAQADGTRLFLDRYRVMGTSGSTGRPGIFLYDNAEGPTLLTSFARALLWGGITTTSKVAVIASTVPGHMSAQLPVIVRGQVLPTFHLAATDPIAQNVQRLNELQPDVLIWYPSIAPVFTREKREGRLTITPHAIFCSAEPLSEERRREITEVWGLEPFNSYSTTEAGVLAAECESHQGLHLFEDFTIVETVDEKNQPVPPGTTGSKVLLTVLFRRAQPLIRYEMSDLLHPHAKQCSCGRPFALINTVQGRKLDTLHFPAKQGGQITITSDIFNSVLDMVPVTGWQVVQELDGLRVLLTGATAKLRDEQVLDALQQALARRDIIVPPMQVERVTTLIRNANGKAPMLLSRLPQTDE